MRRIILKVFDSANKRVVRRIVIAAPKGKRFTPKGVDDNLASFCEELERKLPSHLYRLVQVGPSEFNFVWGAKVAA
jgi:hypothetical protein